MTPRILVLLTVTAAVFGTVAFSIWAVAPVLKPIPILASTRILDRNGGLLYEVADPEEGVRNTIPLEGIPSSLKDAVIAAEDMRFARHRGVDILSTIRAAKDLILTGRIKGGASTIEQQVVKNLYFRTAPRSFVQKAREVVAAMYWSMTHTKEQTFDAYLNTSFFGNRTVGAAAAAKTYFHKDIRDLTVAESAMLAGVLPAPSEYDPYRHRKNAKTRQAYVLDRMVATGVLTEDGRKEAAETAIEIFPPQHDIRAPHFVFRVLDEAEKTIPDIRTGGYVVRTTLDPDLQTLANATVARRIAVLKNQDVTDAAVLAVDPRSGEVLAYVGSAGYFDEGIDGNVDMIQAKRQPGSALKPFMYLTAFMQGLTPATVIADLPVRFETADGKAYYPRNYSNRYFGPVAIRDALGSSMNIAAVKVLDRIGVPSFFATLARFGIRFPEPPDYYGLGSVLGGGEVTLWDATRAYASLALYGRSVDMVDVLTIEDQAGTVVYSSPAPRHDGLFDDRTKGEQASALITDILSDKTARSRSFGEANLLDTGKRIAVKTGTTKDFRDNWAFGYTPDFVLGVWVGNADGSPMQGVSGITGAVPIWHDIMRTRVDGKEDIAWPAPSGLLSRDVCVTSGLLATDVCPKRRIERFIPGTEPTTPDDWYRTFEIDMKTGLLAADACRDRVTEKTFLVPPPEYSAWVSSAKYERPPDRDCTGMRVAAPSDDVTIISPLDGDAFERDTLIEPDSQRIPFMAGGSRQVYRWTLNGQVLDSTDPTLLWDPLPGEYVLSLEGASRKVTFTVR